MFHSSGSVSWIGNSFTVTDLGISSCEMSPAAATGNDAIGTSAETGRLVAGMDLDVDAISERTVLVADIAGVNVNVDTISERTVLVADIAGWM